MAISEQFDLVIRGGLIVDGTGAAPFYGDIGISGGCIVEVGSVASRGRREIGAAGLIVTPGFVDIHTHYDGQAIWENRMGPSSDHGVTTVVTGNCGVGFAPCRPQDRAGLIKLMEGVEDVPEVVMTTGLPWNWQTFPEYLDVLGGGEYDVDIATQVPHSCLRVFIMGERGLALEAATGPDLLEFRRLTREAVEVGALGVGTSRSIFHRFPDGRAVPTMDAGEAELKAIAAGIRDAGHGVMEVLFDQEELNAEFELMCRVSTSSDVPFTFSLFQSSALPYAWIEGLRLLASAVQDGVAAKAQVIGRPTGLVLGLDLSLHPFTNYPSYKKLAHLPLAHRMAEMRKPEVRARILAEHPDNPTHPIQIALTLFDRMFVLSDPPNYEPRSETSIAARAAKAGMVPQTWAYDFLLEEDGRSTLFVTAANYADFTLDAVLTMLKDKNTVLGLGDGGAHYGMICDAGYPTFMLTFWTRDRTDGEKLTLPYVIKALSSEPAMTVGLNDRGLIAPGYRADINVIDYERLHLHAPRVAHNLPGGGRRLVQAATGYIATIVNGVITYSNGVSTGALPGRLVRGSKTARARH
jgi:N-acyl-D-amino-acid deacylase